MKPSFAASILTSNFPIYPLFFAIYPVLYLWSANRAQNSAYVVVPALLITFCITALVFFGSAVLMRSVHRAAFSTFVVSFYLLVFGHVINLLALFQIYIHYRYVMASFLLLPLVFVLARKGNFKPLAQILNPVSVLLVLMTVIPTGYYYLFSANQKVNRPQPLVAEGSAMLPSAPATLPDVYLIIMDGYSREDAFQSRFNFDNSAFVSALEQRGFIFPDCAQSNYPATTPAIASMFNMDYLDALGLAHRSVLTDAGSAELGPYIQDNLVFQKFRAYGYQLVTFRGFLSLIDLKNVDYYVDIEEDVSFEQRSETSSFQVLYVRTTAFYGYKTVQETLLQYFPDLFLKILPGEKRFEQIRQQNSFAVNQLKSMPALVDSPKLVYAHLYASHWPYLINPDGSARLPYSERETDEGYLDGVRYLNNNMLAVIDSILANSKTPPVILLQSDHAYPESEGQPDWSGKSRLPIFNAYYLPGGGSELLYDQITPVNNFRLVFKHYLQEDLALLPDVSYYVHPESGKVETAPVSCMTRMKP
jgi:hypothetical protein